MSVFSRIIGKDFISYFMIIRLKFCEVWFNGENLKVFDVALNDAVVIEGLDIFKKVGRGVAHDEVIPFQVRKNTIIINGKGTNFNNEIRVDFLKVIFYYVNLIFHYKFLIGFL